MRHLAGAKRKNRANIAARYSMMMEGSPPNRKYPTAVLRVEAAERCASSNIEHATIAELPEPPIRQFAMTWSPIATEMLGVRIGKSGEHVCIGSDISNK